MHILCAAGKDAGASKNDVGATGIDAVAGSRASSDWHWKYCLPFHDPSLSFDIANSKTNPTTSALL